MRNRLTSVLVVVLVMAVVLPGAALAASAPGSADAPTAPLLLTWTQKNVSGFGPKDPVNGTYNQAVSALEVFNGQLYAGTTNDSGAEIRRSSDGSNWSTPVWKGGYGQGVLFDLIVFNGRLYAGTGAFNAVGVAGQIWRTLNGSAWERVTGAWEVGSTNNAAVSNFAIHGGMLYMTTFNPAGGVEVFRSSTGNSNDWARVANGSFGQNSAYGIATGLTAFNNFLYVALEGQKGGPGTRIYRTSNGTTWDLANDPGFRNNANYGSGGFAVHYGYLYVSTRNDETGGQIWRTSDGTNWSQVEADGFGNPLNYKIEGMVSARGTLFAFTDNDTTGTEVWSAVDGTAWVPSNTPGFGKASNKAVALWSNGAGMLSTDLYLGTFNQALGGEIWSTTPPLVSHFTNAIYLPFIRR
jgi:hypothetical protein